MRLTAEILEQPGEAEHWLETYGRNVTFARQRLKNRVGEETFLIVRLLKQNLYAYCNRSMAEVFYGDLQLTPACSFGSPIYNRRITLQELAATEADRLLLLICQETETLESWERLQSSLEWQELKAVRTNRVYSILSDPWCEYSANAHNRIVRETLRLLSGDCPE